MILDLARRTPARRAAAPVPKKRLVPNPDRILEITVPLSPLLRPGEEQPRPTKRLRPQDSLDLKHLLEQLAPSTLTTLSVGGKPWSVVSVFSPYTPDLHVMLVEASADRYLPEPLLPELHTAVEARCRQDGPAENWWRKGFGYALVLIDNRRRGSVTLRLLPGVYVGPGGVVEAQRIVLRRPEDRQSGPEAVRRRSDQLWALAANLEQRFPTAG